MMRTAFFILLLIAAGPAQVRAQGSREMGKEKEAPVPKAYLPPPGMCRVWLDNVPAARQPAPTECATAIRNKPPNARIVFGPAKDGKSVDPKRLAPGRPRPDTTKRKPPN